MPGVRFCELGDTLVIMAVDGVMDWDFDAKWWLVWGLIGNE